MNDTVQTEECCWICAVLTSQRKQNQKWWMKICLRRFKLFRAFRFNEFLSGKALFSTRFFRLQTFQNSFKSATWQRIQRENGVDTLRKSFLLCSFNFKRLQLILAPNLHSNWPFHRLLVDAQPKTDLENRSKIFFSHQWGNIFITRKLPTNLRNSRQLIICCSIKGRWDNNNELCNKKNLVQWTHWK